MYHSEVETSEKQSKTKSNQAITSKNFFEDPDVNVPYGILIWFERSSALVMGAVILFVVRKAAKFAVYDEMIISVKNHHTIATVRVEMDLGAISLPAMKSKGT